MGSRTRLASSCALILAAGCYEISPEIPDGYIGSPAAPGWPPPAVYDADSLHPRNRWFHRAFGRRGLEGDALPAPPDAPSGSLMTLGPVDRAEIAALLARSAADRESAARGALVTSPRARAADAIFRSDALAEASRLAAEAGESPGGRGIVSLLLAAARARVGSQPLPALPREAVPPPLREGEWIEKPPPRTRGLQPSAADIRWTRVFAGRERPKHTLLLRLRTALDLDGKVALLPLASECWESETTDGPPRFRVWRFDRAEWLRGGDPWRAIPPGTAITIRSPLDPSSRLTGLAPALCASCHGTEGDIPLPAPREAASAAEGSPEELMADLAARALAPILDP
ncbi:MAG TPA: hypothetical protein VMT52_17235 [Planctomycetota bacterium]|nr:hypothetical protein [Planctomycetota bacterium]